MKKMVTMVCAASVMLVKQISDCLKACMVYMVVTKRGKSENISADIINPTSYIRCPSGPCARHHYA
ncbi:unnamed protein product, partial [Vitis vinifera]